MDGAAAPSPQRKKRVKQTARKSTGGRPPAATRKRKCPPAAPIFPSAPVLPAASNSSSFPGFAPAPPLSPKPASAAMDKDSERADLKERLRRISPHALQSYLIGRVSNANVTEIKFLKSMVDDLGPTSAGGSKSLGALFGSYR